VNYLQVDHKIRKISVKEGVIIQPSQVAYRNFQWSRDYFKQKPKEGYFIWIKKQIDYPLTACITISSIKVSQNLRNLVVIEKGIKAEMNSICNASKKNLCGNHKGYSKIILKEGSELKMKHFHNWGEKDKVSSSLEFSLAREANLLHSYKCLKAPMKLRMENKTYLQAYSSANLATTVLAKDGEIEIHDLSFLDGKESSAVSKIRMVGDKKSKIVARSLMAANQAGTGHVDCMGLLLAENSIVQAMPELINKNKNASLTHEASVGQISEENLNYLKSRGLTKNEAIDLIVAGFLGEEEPIVVDGHALPSEVYM